MIWKNIFVIIGGLIFSVVVGHFATAELVARLRKNRSNVGHSRENYNWLVGCLERFVYTIAFLMKYDWFIAIWLGMKGIGRWTGNRGYGLTHEKELTEKEKNHAHATSINTFLIGNLVSLIIAAFGAGFIKFMVKEVDFTKLF